VDIARLGQLQQVFLRRRIAPFGVGDRILVNAQLGRERLLAGRAANELEALAERHATAVRRAGRLSPRQLMCVAFSSACGDRMSCNPCFLHQANINIASTQVIEQPSVTVTRKSMQIATPTSLKPTRTPRASDQ